MDLYPLTRIASQSHLSPQAERGKKKELAPGDQSFPFHLISVDRRFLFAAAAALSTASLVASLASPTAFWPLPLASWITPSPCRRSEPVASPIPCFALPMASLVAPLTLSAVLPMEHSFQMIELREATHQC